MIDTVHLYAKGCYNYILPYLNNVKEKIDHQTGEIVTYGSFKNLKITLRSDIIFISGSLSTYLFGCNINPLLRKQIKQVIEDIAENLHIPLKTFIVSRIDINNNLIMKNNVSAYYASLGESNYLKKYYYDKEGLIFKNNTRSMVFYNKLFQLKKPR